MNDKKKNILLGVLVVGVISMTVAFAALTTRLKIGGTANIAATSWNIRFEGWTLHTEGQVNGHNNTAVYPTVSQLTQLIDTTNPTKITGLNVTLNQPGDYAEYYFKIANRGSIDAKLNNFTHNMTTSNDVIDYDVDCYTTEERTGTAITTNHVLTANGGLVYCKLRVQYIDQTNSHTAGTNQVYHQDSITTSLSADWTWVQADGSGSSAQTGGQGSNTPVNPYETTFAGNYIAYKWNDVSSSGYENAGTYHSSENWNTTLNPSSTAYLRTNGTIPEACAIFPTGTVCLTSSYYNSDYSTIGNYNSDFEDCTGKGTIEKLTSSDDLDNSCIKGYAKAKAGEMLSKGATYCDILVSGNWKNISCYGTGYLQGYIANGGEVYSNGESVEYSDVTVYSDGETY